MDPGHDDKKVSEMEEICQEYLAKKKPKALKSVEFAREGACWEI
jgi:hypothetical protein